ncbi:N-acetylglutaminylglutamine amidotransferase [Euzebya sp.]|uniref:N-acetylglutaminylglutamine amidotransferase n=1 Tax=Euzebya sp. TaxID=1971409 RepID=UPI00351380E2
MCGFAGEHRTDGREADDRAVARMAATMDDRGPDGQGLQTAPGVAMGHRRLRIIDLTDAGAQPMRRDDMLMVFNGCIYNYPELRRELISLGWTFTSTSDTEVIMVGWRQWGEDLLDRLQGMFAFALHDERTGRTTLVRDRLGIKPLYTAETPGGIRFASTLPALLAGGGVDTSIDTVALHHYLTFHSVVPAPRTIITGVRKVPPATITHIERDGTTTTRRWWSATWSRREDRSDWTSGDWVDATLDVMRRAVTRRLVADVPVGVLLSGGLDSSLVVGLLAEAGQTGLATFSVGFGAVRGEAGDEFEYSDVIAREFDTNHHQIRVPGQQTLDALTPTIAAMNEPMVSHDCVGFFLLSQEVAKNIKVVQSGQGADELFAGYHWYPPMAAVGPDQALATYRAAFFDRDHEDMADVVAPDHLLDHDASGQFVADHFAQPGADSALDRALRLDANVMLVDDPVKRVDSMTMAWGLEARVPFLDHEVVEFAASAPPELHLEDGGKGLLKAAGRKVIPNEVIDRPKGYFPVPALKYLEGDVLDHVRDALTNDAARSRGLFRREYVDRLSAAPNDDLTPLRGNRLWQLGLLELWLQTHGI